MARRADATSAPCGDVPLGGDDSDAAADDDDDEDAQAKVNKLQLGGVRDVRELTTAASAHGLVLRGAVAMPANNHSLLFRRA